LVQLLQFFGGAGEGFDLQFPFQTERFAYLRHCTER